MIKIIVSKADQTLTVDWDAMPENARQHIIEYGLRQKLNDAGSQFTKKELGEEAGKLALGAAENILSELMKGNVSVRQAAVALTLEEREEQKILHAMYKAAFGKNEDKWNVDELAKAKSTTAEKLLEAIAPVARKRAELKRQENLLKAEAKSISIEL